MGKAKPDLNVAFQQIRAHAVVAARAEADAKRVLESIKDQLIGRRVDSFRTGNLKGKYQITDVEIGWDGSVRAHGLKVTTGGKLGNQRWEIGTIQPRRLGL
jgi:hypothetical protein